MAYLIVLTLVHLLELVVIQTSQHTVGRLEHDGHHSDENLAHVAAILVVFFLHEHVVGVGLVFVLLVVRIGNLDSLAHINVQRGGITVVEILESRSKLMLDPK